MTIPFSPPYIDDDVKREVMDTLESGWITSGKKVLALEQAVARYTSVDRVACVNSATSALMLMLHWYGVRRGDEVIIPAYTYAATALAVMHVGATPVMVDCRSDFNIDTTRLKDLITPKTKAIIPVDIAGWPCDYQAIQRIVEASRHIFKAGSENQQKLGRVMVLSDAAHSIGSTYNGKPTALASDFTVFSFHAVKNITTAEGGAICINLPSDFNREEIYKQLKLWSLNGQTKDALSKTMGAGWKYDIVYPGFKMNMPDICAAIGLAQLRKYSKILEERRRVYDYYRKQLEPHDWAELPPPDSQLATSSYHLFALRIRGITEAQRDDIIDYITGAGVSVNVHFQPLPLLSVFRDRGYDITQFKTAYDSYAREISLPIYPELDAMKLDFILKCVLNAYQQVVHAQADV